MGHTTARTFVGFAIVVILVSGAAGALVSWLAPAVPWCKVANTWARSVNARDLPKNLTEFIEIPIRYRAPIWGLLSPEVRSLILRETYLAAINSGKLTEEQVAFLRTCVQRVTPQFCAEHDRLNTLARAEAKAAGLNRPSEPREDLLALEDEAFGKEARRLFSSAQLRTVLSPFGIPQSIPKQMA
jgi:hypothetical protein